MNERLRKVIRHDLRSPLAVILGRADMLLEGINGVLSAEQRRSVLAIVEAAERLRAELDLLAEQIDSSDGAGS